jgi:SAM-dependent methyltransferase
VCGHAEADVVAEEDDIRREVEALWAFHQKRLRADTPVERLRDRVAFSQDPPWRLVACRECGLVYRNPAERAFEVESIYARDCPPRDVLQALHDTQRPSYAKQAKRLARLIPRGSTVLEVGSYVGAFLAAARDEGLGARGVDINPNVNEFTRSLGFDVADGQLVDQANAPVDAIAIWNTFDQLSDPRGTIAGARRLLRPGGMIAIRVPNGDYYRREREKRASRLAHNNLLAFPYRWGFSPHSLGLLLESAGFQLVNTVGDVLVPTADEWTLAWARIEERLAKMALRVGRSPSGSPWFEIYGTLSEYPSP